MTDTFDQFRQQLHAQVQRAESLGMRRDDVVAGAQRIGDWLASEVKPASPEQRLLREMWRVSDPREQQAIASTLVKMVERQP
jgi:hypothetical protein